jgi:hypothetical protein
VTVAPATLPLLALILPRIDDVVSCASAAVEQAIATASAIPADRRPRAFAFNIQNLQRIRVMVEQAPPTKEQNTGSSAGIDATVG